jgi:hypothetical protein
MRPDATSAWKWLQMEQRLYNENNKRWQQQEEEQQQPPSLLEERCIAAIAKDWQTVQVPRKIQLSSRVWSNLMTRVLDRARDDFSTISKASLERETKKPTSASVPLFPPSAFPNQFYGSLHQPMMLSMPEYHEDGKRVVSLESHLGGATIKRVELFQPGLLGWFPVYFFVESQ